MCRTDDDVALDAAAGLGRRARFAEVHDALVRSP